MPTESPTPVERAFAAAIYAPIGLGAKLVDEIPNAATKVRQQLVFARFIGKMAVDQSVRTVRERVEGLTAPVDPLATVDPVAPVATDAEESFAEQNTVAPVDEPEVAAPDVDDLALPDYDHLPAAHIVGKLSGLTPSELDAVETYELAHRHRRTVLGKITQVRQA